MSGIESIDEQLHDIHDIHARREKRIDALCELLVAIDGDTQRMHALIDRKLDEATSCD